MRKSSTFFTNQKNTTPNFFNLHCSQTKKTISNKLLLGKTKKTICSQSSRRKQNQKSARDSYSLQSSTRRRSRKNSNKKFKPKNMKKSIAYIDEAIKYKSSVNKQNNDRNNKRADVQIREQEGNRENERRLFMKKIIKVYELVLQEIRLPQFVQYFLGQALFFISDKTHQGLGYDWKLDEFKKVCEGIFRESQNEDLDYFMELQLPEVSRWGKGIGVGLTVTTQMMNRLKTSCSKPISKIGSHESRFSWLNQNNYSQNDKDKDVVIRDRLNYFKCLSRKQPIGIKEGYDCEVLDRVERKLDQYLNRTKATIDATSNIK